MITSSHPLWLVYSLKELSVLVVMTFSSLTIFKLTTIRLHPHHFKVMPPQRYPQGHAWLAHCQIQWSICNPSFFNPSTHSTSHSSSHVFLASRIPHSCLASHFLCPLLVPYISPQPLYVEMAMGHLGLFLVYIHSLNISGFQTFEIVHTVLFLYMYISGILNNVHKINLPLLLRYSDILCSISFFKIAGPHCIDFMSH